MSRITFNTSIDGSTKALIDKWATTLTRGQVIDAALVLYDEAQGVEKRNIGDVVMRLDLMTKGLQRIEDRLDGFLGIDVPEGEGSGTGSQRVPEFTAVGDTVPSGQPSLQTMIHEMEGNGSRVEAAHAAVSDTPKNCLCVHCGKKFAGSRFMKVCPECAGDGHRGDVRDCPKCGDYGTGAL